MRLHKGEYSSHQLLLLGTKYYFVDWKEPSKNYAKQSSPEGTNYHYPVATDLNRILQTLITATQLRLSLLVAGVLQLPSCDYLKLCIERRFILLHLSSYIEVLVPRGVHPNKLG